MKVDLFSIVQDGKRTLSFMSQALGLMADLDVGTEHLRWMGDTRFVYGLLRGREFDLLFLNKYASGTSYNAHSYPVQAMSSAAVL